jgi:hypothetical protein
VVARVIPGREQAIRDYGKSIEDAVKADPTVLAPLRLHYLRWILFGVASRRAELHHLDPSVFGEGTL